MEQTTKVVLAKRVAEQWVKDFLKAEFRVDVYYGTGQVKNLVGLLRSVRDGKTAVEGLPLISDLGLREGYDYLSVWSSDHDKMLSLVQWLESKGYETSRLW